MTTPMPQRISKKHGMKINTERIVSAHRRRVNVSSRQSEASEESES